MPRPWWLTVPAVGALLACAGSPARAHEFWIDPVPPLSAPGAVATDMRVGESFKGDVFPFLSSGFNFLRVAVRGRTMDVAGNEGDLPAISIPAASEGLNVIAFNGKPNDVVFDDAAKFLLYLETEGLDWVVAAHRARGLPMTGFKEIFSRNVKTLVQVGPVGNGDADVVIGMPLELVAEANPYASPRPDALPVRLLWQGEPLAGTQISIFRQKDAVSRATMRTDAQGRAVIPLGEDGRFLLNAVHIREAPPRYQAAWESHWASLTFHLGDR